MWKYTITRIKGNDAEFIQVFDTKDEAMKFGAKYFLSLPKGEGIVSLDAIEVDENSQRIGDYQKVYHVWY